MRRLARKQRESEWAAFDLTKPDEKVWDLGWRNGGSTPYLPPCCNSATSSPTVASNHLQPPPTTYNHLQPPPTTSNHQADHPTDLAAIANASDSNHL